MKTGQLALAVIGGIFAINLCWAQSASGVSQATSSKYATNQAEACDTALNAAEELANKKAMTPFISITDKHCDCSEKDGKSVCLGFVEWKTEKTPNLID